MGKSKFYYKNVLKTHKNSVKRKQNKEKRMKRIEDSLRDLWDNIKHTIFELYGSQKKRKRKGLRKYLKRL